MNNLLKTVLDDWRPVVEASFNTDGFKTILSGKMSKSEYASLMKEIYYQVREHPQALAALTRKLRGPSRDLVRPVLSHALSEVGHDKLALDDREALGFSNLDLPEATKSKATQRILDWQEHLMKESFPAYLGYIFHHEFMSTHYGPMFGKAFAEAGIPKEAMTFLSGHIEDDEAHNKLMGIYVENLVKTYADLELMCFSAKRTAELYADFISEAINGDKPLQSIGRPELSRPLLYDISI